METDVLDNKILTSETFVCFSCMRPNDADARFCQYCNTPISQGSSNDPLQLAHTEGLIYRRAVESKPKLVVVLGVWIIFFPGVIASLIGVPLIAFEGQGTIGFVLFWLGIITGGFSFLMLYKVTKNYFFFDDKRAEIKDH